MHNKISSLLLKSTKLYTIKYTEYCDDWYVQKKGYSLHIQNKTQYFHNEVNDI
jgi:hypothetical protein